jgi:hypothetical protein
MEPNFGAFSNITVVAASPTHETVDDYQQQTEFLRDKLLSAQRRTKAYADKRRTERPFAVGEQVILKLQPYAQHTLVNLPYSKLSYKFFGLYMVLEKIGEVAYKLQLPVSA